MRYLHPPLFVVGIWLFSWENASAQPSFETRTVSEEGGTAVTRGCHRALEPHMTTEASATITALPVPSGIVPRVRTLSGALDTIVSQAIARSKTFRQLVQVIGRTDGLVYVEPGRCPHGVRACLLDVRRSGPNRLVRVRVGANKADWDLMGSVAHELQHAVEVLRNPAITTTTAMHAYYLLQGRRINNVFETDAAIRAGDEVRAEVRRPPGDVRRDADYQETPACVSTMPRAPGASTREAAATPEGYERSTRAVSSVKSSD